MAAAANPTAPTGNVDVISHERIEGWAWNPDHPASPVTVELYDGPDLLMRVMASEYREDLRNAGIGTGRYGFRIRNLSALLPLARHRISIRRAGTGVELPGSPQWVQRPAAGIDPSSMDFLAQVVRSGLNPACTGQELDACLAAALSAVDVLQSAREGPEAPAMPRARQPEEGRARDAAVANPRARQSRRSPGRRGPIRFENPEQPTVTIIVPTDGTRGSSDECLRSIASSRNETPFEVIVVSERPVAGLFDPGSAPTGAVKVRHHAGRQGLAALCNRGAADARGRYLCFLGTDTRVTGHWLDALRSTFETLPRIGVAGARLLSADGRVAEAGAILWRLGDRSSWGAGLDPDAPGVAHLRDCDCVSAAAFLVPAELFARIGGFDEGLAATGFEAADLCLRILAAGQRVVVQPASNVVIESRPSSRAGGLPEQQPRPVDQRKFLARWSEVLAHHRFLQEKPELEVDRIASKRALFIDDLVPTPDQDAGSNAALQHMLALMNLGYKVTFVAAGSMLRDEHYTGSLQRLGIECLYAPYIRTVEEALRELPAGPDVVYLHRYRNAARYAALCRQYHPRSHIVYNVADLHFLRQQREKRIEGRIDDRPVGQGAELAAMRDVDAVIVHSGFEATLLRRLDRRLRVHVVPWAVVAKPPVSDVASRAGYAFVGGYGHRPNVDGAVHLARDIVPLVSKGRPGLKGYLVGSRVPAEISSLAGPDLAVVGHVPDLTAYLHTLRCTVAPLRYGAGLKGKVLDSLAHGIPCVMSPVAAEGFDLPRELRWLVARTPREFARKVIVLNDDAVLNRKISDAALRFVRRAYGAEVVERSLAQSLRRRANLT